MILALEYPSTQCPQDNPRPPLKNGIYQEQLSFPQLIALSMLL